MYSYYMSLTDITVYEITLHITNSLINNLISPYEIWSVLNISTYLVETKNYK